MLGGRNNGGEHGEPEPCTLSLAPLAGRSLHPGNLATTPAKGAPATKRADQWAKTNRPGGGGTEPKPARKRPWRKPRLLLVEFAATKATTFAGDRVFVEGATGLGGGPNYNGYDPNIS